MTYPQTPNPDQSPQGWRIPPHPAPEPPKKKVKKWPWVVGAIGAILVVGGLSGGGDKEAGNPDASYEAAPAGAQPGAATVEAPSNKPASEAAATMNAPVRDGKFEFVVTDVQTGLSSLGDNQFLAEEAQGQFVIVTMTVQNTADEPKGLSPDNQEMYDTKGRKFTADTSAGLNLDTDVALWDEINPGNTVTMKVVYDMPIDAAPAEIELHDSMFSGGVRVSLR
ncbi:DUF4352 domain-containing protein [Rhodococcus sp. PvR099]|uniref:DUF4352 domain-containing protein n=1 Tax=Rhodococcus sp. PvR099 TaxID=2806602 RepID=UPI001AE741F3|nr:DUF4352 domain-containing protein [Rhodococcus sp. PvR099]MBP1160231.1 hypothetical protein [Rhodococcus sp. PvR099]